MKNLIISILNKISRVIWILIPVEFKFNSLEKKLKNNLVEQTFNYFNEYISKSVIFDYVWDIREYAIKTALLNDKNKEYYYLEFGVYKGGSANFFSKFLDKLYCFDSFEGLREDWIGYYLPKNTFNLNRKIPKLNLNVEPIVGWVEDTLDDFLKKHNPKINFIHLDMDTYSPTKFTLSKLKPYLVKNSIIIFDELYNYQGWKNGEFKALKEVFKDGEFEYLSFNIVGSQCVIQIK